MKIDDEVYMMDVLIEALLCLQEQNKYPQTILSIDERKEEYIKHALKCFREQREEIADRICKQSYL